MPRGNPSPKVAITINPDIHKNILAAGRVSAWMTAAAREALPQRAGLAAIALAESSTDASRQGPDGIKRLVRASGREAAGAGIRGNAKRPS